MLYLSLQIFAFSVHILFLFFKSVKSRRLSTFYAKLKHQIYPDNSDKTNLSQLSNEVRGIGRADNTWSVNLPSLIYLKITYSRNPTHLPIRFCFEYLNSICGHYLVSFGTFRYLDLAFWSWSIWSAISLAVSVCFLRRVETCASCWRVCSSKSRRSFNSSCSLFLFNSI